VNFNKVCELEDFSDPELVAVIRDVCAHKGSNLGKEFPSGAEARKDWGAAMAVRSLRHFGAFGRDAVILGVGTGTEDTIFYLTRHVGQVFATDRYLGADSWSPLAPVAMLAEPAFLAPFEFEPQRLVVQHMDARALRYPDQTFDGIFSSGSIEHLGQFDDIANAAFEMGRVLKPGGILALSTEFRVAGPPGGIGWPGRTLLLSAADLHRYIVEASGLELVDELRVDVSDETMATRRDIGLAMAAHEERLAGLRGGDTPEYTHWDFPHVILVHDGYVFGSVHLTLRRPDAYPSVPNAWARPGQQTLRSISAANAEILTESSGTSNTSPAPTTGSMGPAADPCHVESWEDCFAAIAEHQVATSEHERSASTQLESLTAHRLQVELDMSEIGRAELQVERMLGELTRLRADLTRRPSRQPLHDYRLTPVAEPDRSGWKWCEVSLGGRTVTVVVDPTTGDFMSRVLATGQPSPDDELVAMMLEIVQTDDLVVDVGAKIGTFALAAAATGCPVVAVEASSVNTALLRASASANGFRNLRVVGSSSSHDLVEAVDVDVRGAREYVATRAFDPVDMPALAVTVEALLAEMGLAGPAFVKMDVGGSEVAVLKGMRRLLEPDDAPIVLYRSDGNALGSFDSSPAELVAEFSALGYTNYLVEPGRLIRIDPGDMQAQAQMSCLALKRKPESLRRWEFTPPLTFEERIVRIADECRSPYSEHRAYIATALRAAHTDVLTHPVVASALRSLGHDPVPAVREASDWWLRREPLEAGSSTQQSTSTVAFATPQPDAPTE